MCVLAESMRIHSLRREEFVTFKVTFLFPRQDHLGILKCGDPRSCAFCMILHSAIKNSNLFSKLLDRERSAAPSY